MYFLQATYRKIALSLAFLMFFTSLGLAVDMHFCQGNLKSIAFFGKAKNCHELAKGKPSCPMHANLQTEKEDGNGISKKQCCSSKSLYFQSEQDQVLPGFELKLDHSTQLFLFAFTRIVFHDYTTISNPVPYLNYKPPLIQKDIPVLFESFLL